MKKFLTFCAAVLLILAGGSSAVAGGSDGPTPYAVTTDGITLPAGAVFDDGGHVNIRTDTGARGIHFEALNNQPSGKWIGASFLPWTAFNLPDAFCVEWVQISDYNQHYGEGGQEPVCVGQPTDPEPSEEPTTEPTEEPVDEPNTEPTEDPTEEPTEAPVEEPGDEPTGEPTEQPTDEPTEEPTEEPATEQPVTEEPATERPQPIVTDTHTAPAPVETDEPTTTVTVDVPEPTKPAPDTLPVTGTNPALITTAIALTLTGVALLTRRKATS